jgi:hypothetical protein
MNKPGQSINLALYGPMTGRIILGIPCCTIILIQRVVMSGHGVFNEVGYMVSNILLFTAHHAILVIP